MTFNVADFPSASTDPYDVDIIHRDAFLLDLLDLAPPIVIAEIREQAAANRREPQTLESSLDALGIAGAPNFAHEVLDRAL